MIGGEKELSSIGKASRLHVHIFPVRVSIVNEAACTTPRVCLVDR